VGRGTLSGEALREETECTCGAGHGSGEPHMDWCAYKPSPPVASPPASVEEIELAADRIGKMLKWVMGEAPYPYTADNAIQSQYDDLTALLSDRAAMAERVAGLERDLAAAIRSMEASAQDHIKEWERADASEAEVARLREALEPFSLMAGELFAHNWNSLTTVVDWYDVKLIAGDFFNARAALTRPMGEPKLPDGWLKEGIDAALTRPDEPTKET